MIPQIGISFLLFKFFSFIFMYSPPDYYGTHKKIPEGIEIYESIEKEPTENDFINYDLVLVNSFQPGIYGYYTDYNPTELGYFYIKAFEITSNDNLSEERIKERSKIEI